MICPKCHGPNRNNAKECEHCSVVFAHIGKAGMPERRPNEQCGWPSCRTEADCRMRTPKGWLSLCATHYDHYWRHSPLVATDPNGNADRIALAKIDEGKGFRHDWYRERKLPYEPPKGAAGMKLWKTLYGPQRREREPGDDDDTPAD